MGYDFFAGRFSHGGFLRVFAVAALCIACMFFSCPSAAAVPAFSPDVVPSSPEGRGEVFPSGELLKAVRQAERSLSLQTEIPVGGKTMQRENDGAAVKPPSVRFSENAARVVLYGGIIAIALVALMTLKDNLWSGSRSRRLVHEDAEETAPAGTYARMEKARAEAEDLASAGSFAEAMHILLLQSVNELRKGLDISIAASLTSREILHRVSLPVAGKNAFAEVIGWVEISYFGFHEATREEYVSCRESYETLTAELRRGSGGSRRGSGRAA